jgi:hypothetical protein
MALPPSPTPRLGVRTVSDFPPVIRTMTESSGGGGNEKTVFGTKLCRLPGIRITGVRITKGLLTIQQGIFVHRLSRTLKQGGAISVVDCV